MSDSDNDTDRKRDNNSTALSPIKPNVESSEGSDETSSSESSSEESNNGNNKIDNVTEAGSPKIMEWSLGSFINKNRQNEISTNNLKSDRCSGSGGGSQKDSEDDKDEESGSSASSASNSPHHINQMNKHTNKNSTSNKPDSPSTAEENDSIVPEQINLTNNTILNNSNNHATLAMASSDRYAFDKHLTPSYTNGKPIKSHIEGVESDHIATVLQEMGPIRTPISSLDSDSDAADSKKNCKNAVMATTSDNVSKVKVRRPSQVRPGRIKKQQLSQQENSSDDDSFSSSNNTTKNQVKPKQEKKGRGRPRKQPKEQTFHNAQSKQLQQSTLPDYSNNNQVPKKTTSSNRQASSGSVGRKDEKSKTVNRRRGSRPEAISKETISTDSSSSDDEDNFSEHRADRNQVRRDKNVSPQNTSTVSRRTESSMKPSSDDNDTELSSSHSHSKPSAEPKKIISSYSSSNDSDSSADNVS